MCLRRRKTRIADKAVLKMMREMGCCGRTPREGLQNLTLQGTTQSFDIIGRDFKARGPWQKLGTDAEFTLSFSRPTSSGLRLRQQRDRGPLHLH